MCVCTPQSYVGCLLWSEAVNGRHSELCIAVGQWHKLHCLWLVSLPQACMHVSFSLWCTLQMSFLKSRSYTNQDGEEREPSVAQNVFRAAGDKSTMESWECQHIFISHVKLFSSCSFFESRQGVFRGLIVWIFSNKQQPELTARLAQVKKRETPKQTQHLSTSNAATCSTVVYH